MPEHQKRSPKKDDVSSWHQNPKQPNEHFPCAQNIPAHQPLSELLTESTISESHVSTCGCFGVLGPGTCKCEAWTEFENLRRLRLLAQPPGITQKSRGRNQVGCLRSLPGET